MKTSNKILNYILFAAMAVAGFSMASCSDEPNKYKPTDGVPTVYYIRPTNVAMADSLLSGAYMDNQICIVGDNLTSIYELRFNDQKAILNTSLITNNTLIVTVPGGIPEEVTDKIYMTTAKGKTVTYDFEVLIPAPTVATMSCEFAEPGSVATIYGDYFLDNPEQPLEITFPGDIPVTDIKEITKTAVTFTVPECTEEGKVYVKSIYGTSASAFHYLDSRGYLFDFDEGGTGLGNHGWHDREIMSEGGLRGNYVQLGDGSTIMQENGNWNDAKFSFEYWPGNYNKPLTYNDNGIKLTDLVDFSDYMNMSLKFEMFIPSEYPWSAGAMQVIVAGIDKVTLGDQGGVMDEDGIFTGGCNNKYFDNNTLPRGLYRPWLTEGSYHTNDQWVTVTLPFSEFVYGVDGVRANGSLLPSDFTSLVIFVFGGGINGTECTPIIRIDNIRAVPNN